MSERVRLRAWVDDVQLSNRLGAPHFKNPSELKDAVRELLAELDAAKQALSAAQTVRKGLWMKTLSADDAWVQLKMALDRYSASEGGSDG